MGKHMVGGPLFHKFPLIYTVKMLWTNWSYRADMTIYATLPGPRANMDYRTDMPCNTTLAML